MSPAAYRAVDLVSDDDPPLRPYGDLNLVQIADDPKEFGQAIATALEQGKDADWRVNRARITNNWLAFTGYTLVDDLRLRDVPAGGKATVKCKGGGCPFRKAKKLRVRNRRANATKLFEGDQLAPGAVIEIRITAPDTMGREFITTTSSGSPSPQRVWGTKP